MIKNKDRSGWFGASDTARIMGNWNTQTFALWWCEKLGFIHNNFSNKYTVAGSEYEHKISEAINIKLNIKLKLDRQIKIRKYKLRINLDSESSKTIYEIKTFNIEKGFEKTPTAYIQQVRVQMFFAKKLGMIVAYPMTEEHYKNFFIPVEQDSLLFIPVEQDNEFIKSYTKRIRYLSKCLKKGVFPRLEELNG